MRLAAVLLTCIALMGCTTELDPDSYARPIGDFRLTHLRVNAKAPLVGALSRKASSEDLEAAVTDAVQSRFARFDGPGIYAMTADVAGYVLAAPGIPVLLAPRSLLALNVNLYVLDNGDWRQLNAETNKLVVFEDAGGDTVLGSGYTQSAAEQLAEMSENAAIEIEKWIRDNPDWFTPTEEGAQEGAEVRPQPDPVVAEG